MNLILGKEIMSMPSTIFQANDPCIQGMWAAMRMTHAILRFIIQTLSLQTQQNH